MKSCGVARNCVSNPPIRSSLANDFRLICSYIIHLGDCCRASLASRKRERRKEAQRVTVYHAIRLAKAKTIQNRDHTCQAHSSPFQLRMCVDERAPGGGFAGEHMETGIAGCHMGKGDRRNLL